MVSKVLANNPRVTSVEELIALIFKSVQKS
jgi:hypothetical protein